jgi:hypothetical protein
MMGPAAAAAHAQQLNEDNRQALVLFGIVIIFLACNIPRVVLNFHEVNSDKLTLLKPYKINIIFLACNIPRVVLNFHEVKPL